MIDETATRFFELDTLLAHDPDFPDGAVVPPIFQSSLFTFPSYEAMRAAFAGEVKHPVYSRVGNPTTEVFEAKMAALEGAEAARGFASGMAAISGAVLSVVTGRATGSCACGTSTRTRTGSSRCCCRGWA